MEPHPVPQNIIDVEFKLFGSFSLRQFAKIFIGCIMGVVTYAIEPIPGILRLVLIFIFVFGGILMAIVPRFDVMVWGFVKALFISPRYVWVRELKTPEIFDIDKLTTLDTGKKVSSGVNAKKVRLEEIGFTDENSRLQAFSDKEETVEDFVLDSTRQANFGRTYSQLFGESSIPVKNQQEEISIPSKQSVETSRFKSEHEYIEEIERLKRKLNGELKEPLSKEKEEDIMDEINTLYSELKVLQKSLKPVQSVSKGSKAVLMPVENLGHILFGVVVKKEGLPIEGAKVLILRYKDHSTVLEIYTDKNGKFSTKEKLEFGEYVLKLEAKGYKFPQFKIEIKKESPHGFKFRSL